MTRPSARRLVAAVPMAVLALGLVAGCTEAAAPLPPPPTPAEPAPAHHESRHAEPSGRVTPTSHAGPHPTSSRATPPTSPSTHPTSCAPGLLC